MANMDARGWTNSELEELGLNLVRDGEAAGIRIRLLGGVAVRLLCKEVIAEHPELDRTCGDIDFAGLSEDVLKIERVLTARGFVPHREFNFLNDSSRLLFSRHRLKVDVILDEFHMNHRWPIRERLLPGFAVLSVEDILLTKLQIVKPDKKDTTDLLALSLRQTPDMLDVPYIVGLVTRSWGFTHTALKSCESTREPAHRILADDAHPATVVFETIRKQILAAPKGLGWKLRSLFGERIQWYDAAEEPLLHFR